MKKRRSKARCTPSSEDADCCAVKAVVTIDERGQMVLPKELRDEIDIHAGDKLAVIAMGQKGKVCCLSLMKAEELSDAVKIKFGSVLSDKDKKRRKK